MKLFISWSGQTSQAIANELRTWFPLILPSVSPFITTTDIEKGAQWQGTIRQELEKSNYGLVILTQDNLASQWLAFEAGALSKHLEGRVATVLFNTTHGAVKPPLSLFQGTIFSENDFRQLVSDINKNVSPDNQRGEEQLDTLFPMLWPKLKDAVDLLMQTAATVGANPTVAEAPDYPQAIQEMMALLRQQNSLLSSPEKLLAPIIDSIDQRVDERMRLSILQMPPGTGKSRLARILFEAKSAKSVFGDSAGNASVEDQEDS
jgi:TIR domain